MSFYPKSRRIDLVLSLAAILIVAVMAWFMLGQIKKNFVNDLEISLATINKTTSVAIERWFSDQLFNVEIWAKSPRLSQLVKEQLEVPQTQEALLASPALKAMRSRFQSTFLRRGFLDFTVLSLRGVCIASSKDYPIGRIDQLTGQADILPSVFQDSSFFIISDLSDHSFPNSEGDNLEKRPIAFVASPIRNENGSVIALLILKFDPSDVLTHISRLSLLGKTGETYIFDKKGRLISESSRVTELQKLGLLKKDQTSILNLELRDPGGNLTKGFVPSVPRESQPFTFMASQAISGTSGSDLDGYRNYLGIPVIGVWNWNNRLGLGISSELEVEEAYHSFRSISRIVLAVLGTTILIFVVFSALFAKSRKEAIILAEKATAAGDRLQKEMEDRHHVEKILRENDEFIRAVANALVDGIITTDSQGNIQTCNPATEHMFGYRSYEITGKKLSMLLPDTFRLELEKELETYHQSGKSKFIGTSRELTAVRKDGSIFNVDLSISEMILGDYNRLVAIFMDITRHKQLEDELLLLSSQDGLTGIPNRRIFDETIELEWKRARRKSSVISLIMIDIDFFKNYNDSLGHLAGDECLKKIALLIKNSLNRPGDLAARYGGEEFVILLPETSSEGAKIIAQKIRADIIGLKITHPDSRINEFVTISLGIASSVPDKNSKPEKLISLADKALYKAKHRGRNRVEIAHSEDI